MNADSIDTWLTLIALIKPECSPLRRVFWRDWMKMPDSWYCGAKGAKGECWKVRCFGGGHVTDVYRETGHCTGIEPLMQLRQRINLDRTTAVVGAVGSRFVLGDWIHPTAIAQ